MFRTRKTPLIHLLESCKEAKQALQIHAQIIVNGSHHQIFLQSKLISFFALSNPSDINYARILFTQIPTPNLFIWNTMIRAYSKSDSPRESFLLYKSMLSSQSISPNNFTYPFLLNSCSRLPRLDFGRQIHSHVFKNGFESNMFVINSLIDLYTALRDFRSARQLFDTSPQRDLVSFNTMISSYARSNRATDALRLFQEMRVLGLEPDEFTIVAMFAACSLLGDLNTGKQIHLSMVKKSLSIDFNVFVQNALLDMYAKCGKMEIADRLFRKMCSKSSSVAWSTMVSGYVKCGEIEIARRMFDEMPERDAVSWTAMISGYSQTGQCSEALGLFREMEATNVKPDEVTMVAVLSACAQLGALDFGKKLHRCIENGLFNRNILLDTALVDMYAKCGCIETALEVFYGVPDKSKNVCLFNAMISGLAQHGLGKKALQVLMEMDMADLKPDEITFVGCLCACSHGGLIDEGKELFDSITKEHGISPHIEHYGCMVDLLGRAGLLEEARDFIEKMPIKANSVVLGALLGACRIHGNIEIGKSIGEQLIQLDPTYGGHYVLLSNIFAKANRWGDVREVRKMMENRGLHKLPGWSSIELNGFVHRFFANDRSHPQTREIASMLEEMEKRLRLAGHAPDNMVVLFDIDEEEKESGFSYHSEKLAMAFGLLHLGPEVPIRIMKNLRVCGDCHSSTKLLSKLFHREIVVRDRVRFHHFKDGSCSCMDYW